MIRLAVWLPVVLAAARFEAAEWFVATNGAAKANGTRKAPWEIASALDGRHRVAPGDTIWLQQGRYKVPPQVGGQGFVVKLAGTRQRPIQLRALAGERVTIDGGLMVVEPSNYLWIWDLEILVSEPRPAKRIPPDPTYQNVNRPWGGLNIFSGTGCKFINLVIHDNSQGVSWWVGSRESELYGCVIYDNGWAGTDRGHGHAIYTQNQTGVKTIADCIMTGGFGFTVHAYGSARAYVDDYLVEGNAIYNAGPFLIGGGRPSHRIRVLTNHLYQIGMQLGYTAATNADCVVRGNVIVNGALNIKNFGVVTSEDNLVLPANNSARPNGARIVLRPNKYDPLRTHLVIYNWQRAPEVDVDPSPFLRPGDQYRLMDPRRFYDQPVLSGRYSGQPLRVPVAGEFAAFILLKAR